MSEFLHDNSESDPNRDWKNDFYAIVEGGGNNELPLLKNLVDAVPEKCAKCPLVTGRINEIFSIQQELSAVAGALIDPESDLLAVLQLQQEQRLPEGEAWRVLVESKQAVASHIIEQQWRLYKEMAVATDAVGSLTDGCAGSILAQGSNGEVQVQGRFCGSRDESLQGGPAFETALVERSSDPSGGAGIFKKLLSGGAGIFKKLRNLLDGLRD